MISSVRIQNLRSIKDSGVVELKPLTVLIGRNSSGKSTLLRSFPLLKQSFGVAAADPILWYGPYVDFGSFRNSLSSDCDEGKDTITFELTLRSFMERFVYPKTRAEDEAIVRYEISEHEVTRYCITTGPNKIEFSLDKDEHYSVILNGKKCLNERFHADRVYRIAFPRLNDRGFDGAPIGVFYGFGVTLPDTIASKYYSVFNGSRIREDLEIDFSLPVTLDIVRSKFESLVRKRTVKRNPSISFSEDELTTIVETLFANSLINLCSSLESAIKSELQHISYFQPIRARGDRYYRIQGLRTTEIDSDGENGPMFLLNLSQSERSSFESWCYRNFGFTYSVTNEGGGDNVSVVVKTKDGSVARNMTDVGFGYSQIFPIILSLWNGKAKRAERSGKNGGLFVIEQPELHLHPAFQKRFMKAIIKMIELNQKQKWPISFIIETHSETIINYIGKRISEGLNPDCVNLICCQKMIKQPITTLKQMRFDNDGLIENWPAGFFSDEE